MKLASKTPLLSADVEQLFMLGWRYKLNQWQLFHCSLLLGNSLLLSSWMSFPSSWLLSLASLLPQSLLASMLLPYHVNRYSLSAPLCL